MKPFLKHLFNKKPYKFLSQKDISAPKLFKRAPLFIESKLKNTKWVKKSFLLIHTMYNMTINEMRMLAKSRNTDSYDNMSRQQLEAFLLKSTPTRSPKKTATTSKLGKPVPVIRSKKTCAHSKI